MVPSQLCCFAPMANCICQIVFTKLPRFGMKFPDRDLDLLTKTIYINYDSDY